jgi:hypothetical protein
LLEQYIDGTGAAVDLPRGYKGQYGIPFPQPASDALLKYGSALSGAQSLAVHDSDAEFVAARTA